jgi:hypothetical protein
VGELGARNARLATHNMFDRALSGSITFRFTCDKEDHHASDEESPTKSVTVAGITASLMLGFAGVTLSPAPARAVIYCQYVEYPHGCVARAGVVLGPRRWRALRSVITPVAI